MNVNVDGNVNVCVSTNDQLNVGSMSDGIIFEAARKVGLENDYLNAATKLFI